MFKIDVSVKGTSPLLQHRFPEEDNPEHKSTRKKLVHNAQDDAEKALYRSPDGIVHQPATHLEMTMVKAATAFKMESKKTFKDAFKGGVFVEPDTIPHKIQKWEVDKRPVVIQKARIMRARPRFDKWELDFTITVTDDRISSNILKEILDYAGLYVGIGDFRPRFGRFMVTKFEG